jgi:hypothetical protein
MIRILILNGFMILLLLSCKQENKVDLEKERQTLLEMHQSDRQAHFERDPYALLEVSLDTFISVSNAKITRGLKKDRITFFKNNFEGATYSKWDNLEEPIVRISSDGTLAWMIIRIEVSRTKKNENGDEVPEGFTYAGIMTYKKVNGKWMKEANVSTFESITD